MIIAGKTLESCEDSKLKPCQRRKMLKHLILQHSSMHSGEDLNLWKKQMLHDLIGHYNMTQEELANV